jgi:hypothetical protein
VRIFLLFRVAKNRILVVALLAQSLVMFTATEDSLISSDTLMWPVGVELWPTIVVLSLNGIVLAMSLGMCHFAIV